MYLPRSFAEDDLPTLTAFIEAHPLAAIVTSSADGLIATHIPLVLDRTRGSIGTLLGHFARANPHARVIDHATADALVIFTGPDAYITPEWYQSKAESGRVVPTWNYVAVHAYGVLRAHNDPAALRAHLEMLTQRHEGQRERPWQVSDAPDDYIAQQMKAIVAVELEITHLEGKWKMSQNRADADIAGVIGGLGASANPRDHAVAAIVAERRPKE